MKKSAKKAHWGKAAPVSFNLQLGFIGLLALFMLIGLLTVLPTMFTQYGHEPAWTQVFLFMNAVFPLLLFIPAYILGPRFSNPINRAFIAMMYTAVGFMAALFITNVLQLLSTWAYTSSVLPSWMQTYGYQPVIMVAVWSGLVGFLLYRNSRLQRS